MALAAAWAIYPCELRADFQRHYGIDWDRALAGGHSAGHMAALFACLPPDALVFASVDPDRSWTREAVLLAEIRNQLAYLMWGMADPRKRGAKPKPVGPTWMTRGRMRSLEARVLPVGELMAELAKPRR